MRESPLPSRRLACWLPPEARVVMMTPGMALASCRFRSRAICSLERVALVLGHQADRHLGAAAATAATAAAAAAESAAAARLGRDVDQLRHVFLGERLEP